jgi:predicted thioredoxin/glutaredoxin
MGTAELTAESDLAHLDDPALIAHWASARTALALTPRDDPGHAEVKAAYDAVLAEYRRRVATS